jgi:hypothetical protein
MDFNLDEAAERAERQALPWDFALVVDNKRHETRPLTVAEVAFAKRVENEGDDRFFAFVSDLFVAPQPHVVNWGRDKATAALVAVLAYFQARVQKKTLALAEAVAMAVVREATGSSTFGNSSSR